MKSNKRIREQKIKRQKKAERMKGGGQSKYAKKRARRSYETDADYYKRNLRTVDGMFVLRGAVLPHQEERTGLHGAPLS